MSHVAMIEAKLTDLNAVKATCDELGLKFKEGQKTYRWFGRSVGDYPLPKGFRAGDLGQCEHAIEVPGSGYDIGLARAKNADGTPAEGWVMLFDFWGPGQPILKALGGQKGEKFVGTYALNKLTLDERAKGRSVTRIPQPNGVVRLRITSR